VRRSELSTRSPFLFKPICRVLSEHGCPITHPSRGSHFAARKNYIVACAQWTAPDRVCIEFRKQTWMTPGSQDDRSEVFIGSRPVRLARSAALAGATLHHAE